MVSNCEILDCELSWEDELIALTLKAVTIVACIMEASSETKSRKKRSIWCKESLKTRYQLGAGPTV